MDHRFEHEQLPSGKGVIRHFDEKGILVDEQHSHGVADIGISYSFSGGVKIDETYIVKRRLASRRSYEKARLAYPDMPQADQIIEDSGGWMLGAIRKQQRQKKAEAERRFAESAASRFPRPESTNWLRVIARDQSHLVLFTSRDWKVLSREPMIRTGRDWLGLFGFDGPPDHVGSVAKGLEVGFEVMANREDLLTMSRRLLAEVNEFARNPLDTSTWEFRPRKQPPLGWLTALPPLIEFLASVEEPVVKIFNHSR